MDQQPSLRRIFNTHFLMLKIRRLKNVNWKASKIMPGWQARMYVRRVRAVHFLAQEWAEVKRRIPASCASAHQRGPNAAQAPPLHLIPLSTYLPTCAGGSDAQACPMTPVTPLSTSQTDFWRIQTRAADFPGNLTHIRVCYRSHCHNERARGSELD